MWENRRLCAIFALPGLDFSLEIETTLRHFCLPDRLPVKVRGSVIIYKMIVSMFSVSSKQVIHFFFTFSP